MDLSRDIHPLTDFKRNTAEFIAQLKRTGEPVVLTVNGRAELVVQDAASYQKLLDIAQRAAVIEAVQQGLEEMKAGLGRPADEVFADIRRDFSITPDA
ncbi:MAG: type II toxin-antitoxin system Phd/YefM family antitoxin [Isosphaeraceae bacterium]